MASHTHEGNIADCCHHTQTNPSVCQTLDELDFERGLWGAVVSNDEDRVESLLKKGSNPNEKDNSGYTALHYAARSGNLKICKMLLSQGASPNGKTNSLGTTPLQRAAYNGHLEVVKELLKYNCDTSIQDVDGKTALHKALERGHNKILEILINASPELAAK